MDRRLENEVKNLMKIGLPEDLAILCAGIKTGNEDAVNGVLNNLSDENEDLKEALSQFTVYAPLPIQNHNGELLKPTDLTKLFVEVNEITNETKPVSIPDQTSNNQTE